MCGAAGHAWARGAWLAAWFQCVGHARVHTRTCDARPRAPHTPHTPHTPLPSATQNFWTRLANRFGSKFYQQEHGQSDSILNTVAAIDACLREPVGRGQCANIAAVVGEDEAPPKRGLFGL